MEGKGRKYSEMKPTHSNPITKHKFTKESLIPMDTAIQMEHNIQSVRDIPRGTPP